MLFALITICSLTPMNVKAMVGEMRTNWLIFLNFFHKTLTVVVPSVERNYSVREIFRLTAAEFRLLKY